MYCAGVEQGDGGFLRCNAGEQRASSEGKNALQSSDTDSYVYFYGGAESALPRSIIKVWRSFSQHGKTNHNAPAL